MEASPGPSRVRKRPSIILEMPEEEDMAEPFDRSAHTTPSHPTVLARSGAQDILEPTSAKSDSPRNKESFWSRQVKSPIHITSRETLLSERDVQSSPIGDGELGDLSKELDEAFKMCDSEDISLSFSYSPDKLKSEDELGLKDEMGSQDPAGVQDETNLEKVEQTRVQSVENQQSQPESQSDACNRLLELVNMYLKDNSDDQMSSCADENDNQSLWTDEKPTSRRVSSAGQSMNQESICADDKSTDDKSNDGKSTDGKSTDDKFTVPEELYGNEEDDQHGHMYADDQSDSHHYYTHGQSVDQENTDDGAPSTNPNMYAHGQFLNQVHMDDGAPFTNQNMYANEHGADQMTMYAAVQSSSQDTHANEQFTGREHWYAPEQQRYQESYLDNSEYQQNVHPSSPFYSQSMYSQSQERIPIPQIRIPSMRYRYPDELIAAQLRQEKNDQSGMQINPSVRSSEAMSMQSNVSTPTGQKRVSFREGVPVHPFERDAYDLPAAPPPPPSFQRPALTKQATYDSQRSRSSMTPSEGASLDSSSSPNNTRDKKQKKREKKEKKAREKKEKREQKEREEKEKKAKQASKSPKQPNMLYSAGGYFAYIPENDDDAESGGHPVTDKPSEAAGSPAKVGELSSPTIKSTEKRDDKKNSHREKHRQQSTSRPKIDTSASKKTPATSPLPTPGSASGKSWKAWGKKSRPSMMDSKDFEDKQRARSNSNTNKVYTRESFLKKVEYIHRIVASHCPINNDEGDTELRRRELNGNNWKIKNMKCIDCRGDCPSCGISCCIYTAASHIIDQAGPEQSEAVEARKVMKWIDSMASMGEYLCEFGFCTPPDGCGRYVCPDCFGVCPHPICQDVKCRACKKDPSALCDWHIDL